MSPQIFQRIRLASNDIFGLGIVLFRLLNDWRLPGRIGTNGLAEVDDYIDAINCGRAPAIKGFSSEAWHLGESFRHDDSQGRSGTRLRDVVYRMMAFDVSTRYATCDEIIAEIEEMRKGDPHGPL